MLCVRILIHTILPCRNKKGLESDIQLVLTIILKAFVCLLLHGVEHKLKNITKDVLLINRNVYQQILLFAKRFALKDIPYVGFT